MRSISTTLVMLAVAAACPGVTAGAACPGETPGADAATRVDPPGFALYAAKIFTASDPLVINHGVVLVSGDKIEAVGRRGEITVPSGYTIYDVGETWVVPGLIDVHNHSLGNIGDLNDMVYLTNPELAAVSALDPSSVAYPLAAAGGVTTALMLPGSGTNQSGFGAVAKFTGDTAADNLVREPGCLKVAQAGNPERYWYGVARSFMNWSLRQVFSAGRAYYEKYKEAERNGTTEEVYDPAYERWIPVYDRKIPALVHTQWYQVVLETLKMVHDEFGMRTIVGHATFEAWKIGSEVVRRPDVYVINGPRQIDFDRAERRIVGNCWGWYKNGVHTKLGVNCDAVGGGYGGVAQEDLAYQMAMAVHFGMPDPVQAVRGITIVGAEALMLEDRIGSIEPGKDADLAVFDGNPVDPRNKCLMTFINGELVYDIKRDGQRW